MQSHKKSHYAVPAIVKFIQDHWADEIAAQLKTTAEKVRTGEFDFFAFSLDTVRLELMDESCVEFRSACYIVSGEKRAIAVLSEHCGYHVFPIHEAKIYQGGKLTYQQIGAEYP